MNDNYLILLFIFYKLFYQMGIGDREVDMDKFYQFRVFILPINSCFNSFVLLLLVFSVNK